MRSGDAVIGVGGDPAFGVAAAGGILIAVLIVLVGTQLFMSARRASRHLANAAPLPSRSDDKAANTVAPSANAAAGRPGELGANVARPFDGTAPDTNVSGQTLDRLNEYYAANINQGTAIFWASLLSMIIGFAIVFAGIVTAGVHSTTAIVAGIAGVLSQFIAATFLVALRSTQQQSTTYAQTLVELRLRDLRATVEAQAITLGLRLLGEISGDGATVLANQTRAALAMGLIVKETLPPVLSEPITTATGAPDNAAGRTDTATAGDARARAQSVTFDADRDPAAQRTR